mgnify:CR=1 FL=1
MTFYTGVLDVRMIPLLVINPCGKLVMTFKALAVGNALSNLMALCAVLYAVVLCVRAAQFPGAYQRPDILSPAV